MSEPSDDAPGEESAPPAAASSEEAAVSEGAAVSAGAAGSEGAAVAEAKAKTAGAAAPAKKGTKKGTGAKKGTSAGQRSGAGRGPDQRRASARDRVEEFESVLSGRLVLATALCLAMVLIPLSPLGRLIAKKAPESAARGDWKVGDKGRVHVTLITADYDKLDCANAKKVGEAHCAFEDEKKPFPKDEGAAYDDNKRTILQPYRTTDGQLLFMAGLWAQPEIAMRLHREPGRNVPEKKLARFVTECEVEFLEEWPEAMYRWAPRDNFGKGETAMVARPIECHIFEGP